MVTDSDAFTDPVNPPSQEDSLHLPNLQIGRVVIFGVGLLGGSLGQALLKKEIASEVIGIGRSAAPLEEAKRLGAISTYHLLSDADQTEGTHSEGMNHALMDAELIVLCTPVEHIRAILPDVCRHAPDGAIITDVGSTKATIVRAGEAASAARAGGVSFVGSHPMAGSDRSGVAHARPTLFQNATIYITPTEQTNRKALAQLSLLWMALGGRIILCRPERHDELASFTSHLPFLAATSVTSTVVNSDEDRNLLRAVVAGGFRDTTRIAKGHPDMWRDILRDNSPQVLARIAGLRASLDMIEQALTGPDRSGDQLRSFLAEHAQFRAWFDEA